MAEHDEKLGEYVHEPLLLQLWIYVVLSMGLLAFLVYHLLEDRTNPAYPGLGLLLGVILGILMSRMYKIAWDKRSEKVIFQLDVFGAIIFGVYVIFEIWRSSLVAYFIHGPVLANTSLALLTGVMVGRVLGIRGKISSLLKKNL